MTFNTTSLPLKRALDAKLLLERTPVRVMAADEAATRHLLVTPCIDALLDGRVLFGIFPQPSAERLIAVFCRGWLVRVSRIVTQKKPDLEKLEGFDEVWALCPRKPPPGWRLLGRFYDRDVFVVLRAWDKSTLFSRYSKAAKEAIEDWEELFGSQPAHSGANVEDYLSGTIRDVDKEW